MPGWLLALGVLAPGVLASGGCAALPSTEGRPQSSALSAQQAASTQLGRTLSGALSRHPGLSGFQVLDNSAGSLAARIELANSAERTLDVQYYIWHNDESGRLMIDALRRAADRGVRVRLLLDDNGIAGMDPILMNLDLHPLVEVRIFNPFMQRRLRWAGFLTDFRRLNRRMHNKTMTADSQATIVGGRNIGDEYFGHDHAMSFFDLDVLAVGPVVEEVSADFDRYWSSESAHMLSRVLGRAPRAEPAASRTPGADVTARVQKASAASYVQRFAHDTGVDWAHARVLSDDPAKGMGHAGEGTLLLEQLRHTLPLPRLRWYIVSAYFVPSLTTIRMFTTLADRGVRVRVLTNSAAATDVAVVHAGYTRSRRPLLEAGVDIYEMKASARSMARAGQQDPAQPIAPADGSAPADPAADAEAGRGASVGGSGGTGGLLGMATGKLASASSSLHAKSFATDGKVLFIGSFNFDPRSAWTNTEIGIVVESPRMARTMESRFESQVPDNAYRVRLDQDGNVYWEERLGDGNPPRIRELQNEPDANWGLRLLEWAVDILPIRGLL